MKKIISILSVFLLLTSLSLSPLFAQTKKVTPTITPEVTVTTTVSSTPQPTSAAKGKIDQIKDKVANTVAQLNLVSKKAFLGKVTKLDKNQLTLLDLHNNAQLVDLDELTKYKTITATKQTDGKFTDLAVNDTILAIGDYNKESKKLLARLIISKDVWENISGTIAEADIKGNTITVADTTTDPTTKKTYTVDITKKTKLLLISSSLTPVKADINKAEVGQFVHVIGTAGEGDHISALRVLLIPATVSSFQSTSLTPSATTTLTVTPKASPTPTKKITPTITKKTTPLVTQAQ